METWDELRKRASAAIGREWRGFIREWFGHFHSRPFHSPFPVPTRMEREMLMEWRKPRKLIEEKVQKPIQTIAVIAVIALAISAMALFIAMGRDSNAAQD